MRIWNRKSVEKFVLCCRCLVCWPRCLNNTHCLYPFSGFLSGIVLLFCQAGLKCLLNGVDSIFDWTIHTRFAWFWHLGNLNCLQIIHRKNPGATLISSPIYDYMPIANEAMHWLAHWVSEWVNIMFCEWLQRSYPLPLNVCVCMRILAPKTSCVLNSILLFRYFDYANEQRSNIVKPKECTSSKKSFLTMRKQVYFQFSYKLCFLACFLRKNTDSPRINTLNDDFHRRYEPWIKWSNHLLITKKSSIESLLTFESKLSTLQWCFSNENQKYILQLQTLCAMWSYLSRHSYKIIFMCY